MNRKRLGISLAFLAGLSLPAYLFANSLSTSSAQAPDGGVFVEGKIELVSDGDQNQNGEVDAGDTVTLIFTITNSSQAEYPFATLLTGLNYDLVYDLWNVRGAASLANDNGTVTFPNVWVAANSRLTISVEATVKYFTAGQEHLGVSPQLVDRESRPIGARLETERSERQVKPWAGELPEWVVIRGNVPKPVPTPSPSSTPTVTPPPTDDEEESRRHFMEDVLPGLQAGQTPSSPSPTSEPTPAPAAPTTEPTTTISPSVIEEPNLSPAVTP